jgi:Spy/CpxP family protein refolding chaperone
MKIKNVFVGLIFLAVINVAALITIGHHYIGQRNETPCFQEKGHCSLLQKKLDLTKKQATELSTFQKAFQKKAEPLQKILNSKGELLVRLLTEQDTDPVQIDSVMLEINSTQLKLQREVVRHLLLEKDIFTEEQKEIFFNLIHTMLIKEKCPREINSLPMIDTGSN